MPPEQTVTAPVTRRRRGEPSPYDFRRPAKLSRDHVRRLEYAAETFARQWTTMLTGVVRGSVSVQLDAVEQQTYDEWVGALASPAVLVPFSPDPLPGTAVLHLETATALDWVDQMLGGPGGGTPLHRSLTPIEQDVVLDVVGRSLAEMTYAFEQVTRIEPRIDGLEQNPQFLQAAAATDVVVVLKFTVVLAGVAQPASMLLPLTSFVAVMDASRITHAQSRVRAAALTQLEAGMADVPVQVAARLRGTHVSPSRLVALRPGDLLRLDHRADEPLELVTADVVVGNAVSGSRGQRLACLVVEKETR